MKPVSGKRMCRILERKGWRQLRIKGSHHTYGRDQPPGRVTVPVHGNRDLDPGVQRGIMRTAGLTDADL
jgi:predicted RNA binding protein YcfA (HicA-like mRNA interferase family)